jgi:S1-C subfamily serine protease
VLPDSPAAKAGIQPGDILIRIDDTPVAKIEDVHKALTAPGPDRTGNHQVFLQRDGVELQIPVTLPRDP